MLILIALAMQAASPPQPSSTPPPDDADTVVVTATLPQLRAALERCEHHLCTPRQDVLASIRYAEVQFRDGKYLDSRRTLQAAIGRDRHAAKAEPVAVAALYEATVTVALHEGDQKVAMSASGGRLATLRDAFGAQDFRYLEAELADIDLALVLGKGIEAETRYRVLAQRAAAAGQPAIAAMATLRRADWDHASHEDGAAKRRLAALTTNAAQPSYVRDAATIALARLAADRGTKGAIDRGLATAKDVTARLDALPILIFQPPLPDPIDETTMSRTDFDSLTNNLVGQPGTFVIEWADLGFDIAADGTVRDITVLRGSHSTDWLQPVIHNVAKRRYLPNSIIATNSHRIERWTLTADYSTLGSTLIRKRSFRPHYMTLDLTSSAPTSVEPASSSASGNNASSSMP